MARDDAEAAIRKVLLRERRLLRAGDLGGLHGLLDEKSRCLSRAAEIRDRETLRGLRALADRNQALLHAAAQGLRAATSRLAELRQGLGALSTYGADGGRKGLPKPESKLEHRA